MGNVFIKTLAAYTRDVEALETFKGHDDDKRRKRNRKRLLLLRDYVEKEFTPGDLTRTSQLVRLGAQALQKHYIGIEKQPVITSLPGSVTGAVRKSWNLLGCLSSANEGVLNPDDRDDTGSPKVRTKTEIRGITHLHHALDACVLGFASIFLPRDGGAWAMLTKRRLTAEEQRRAPALFRMKVEISADGQLRLPDLPPKLKEQVRQRLAERRVVQHLPAEMAGLPTKETVWRIFDPRDAHPSAERLAKWLVAARVRIPEADDDKVLIIRRKRKGADVEADAGGKVFHDGKIWRWVYEEVEKTKLLGLDGGEHGKLRAIKGGKLIADNYGMALLPNVPKGEKPYRIIRFFRVWEQIEKLRAANGGKRPAILRRGQLITFSKGKREGKTFRIIGLNEDGLVRFGSPDIVRRIDKPMNYEKAQISSLLKEGICVGKARLCGL
jgi:CRISPR-associated endonuclease Csn1